MDKVFVRGLRLETVIGVNAWERTLKQTLLLDLYCETDAAKAAANDNISDALDYGTVADHLTTLAKSASFELIESLAEAMATHILKEFQVTWVRLELTKPGAVPSADSVGIIIERSK